MLELVKKVLDSFQYVTIPERTSRFDYQASTELILYR